MIDPRKTSMTDESETQAIAGSARETLHPGIVDAAVAAVVILDPKLPPFVGD